MVDERFEIMVPGARGCGFTDVFSPYDESQVGAAELCDAVAAERALAVAHSLYRHRDAWLSIPQRIRILEAAVHLMEARSESLATGAAAEGGKPLADSRVEVVRAIDGLRLCADALRHHTGREIPMGVTDSSLHRIAVTRLEPIGVVVAVSAFNHPLNLIVHQVGPAVAAGCPVIVKPAQATALSCLRFVEILREAGLPDVWCQAVVTKDRAVSESLVTDPRVGFFSFIGSGEVGWALRSKLAPGTRCALEHGGVAPVIVAPDADFETAIPALLKGGFYHAGQVCVSVQRIFVHESIRDAFVDAFTAGVRHLVVGDPLREETQVGPLIRQAEVERVHAWVTSAVEGGATLACGGRPMENHCYAPTVLLDPAEDAEVSKCEIFGPVVCVYSYSDVDRAIDIANSLDVAFQSAVFTRDLDFAMRCFRGLDASAVMVNDHTAFRVDWMPFAGLRRSGHGVGGIQHTFEEMQIEKMLVVHSTELP